MKSWFGIAFGKMRRPGDDAVFTCVLAEQVGLPYWNFELNPAKRAQLVRRSIVGEGSRPRDPRFAKPHVVLDEQRKYISGLGTFSRRARTRALPNCTPQRGVEDAFRASRLSERGS